MAGSGAVHDAVHDAVHERPRDSRDASAGAKTDDSPRLERDYSSGSGARVTHRTVKSPPRMNSERRSGVTCDAEVRISNLDDLAASER